MTVPIQNLPIEQTGSTGTQTFDLNGVGAAPVADVDRFDQAMASADTAAGALQPLDETGGSLTSVGTRILESFNGMSARHEATMQRVSTVGGSLETADSMQLLADFMRLSQETSLVSKVVGKGTQTVSDLTK
jgi:hypothetical protein